ncbi:MAG: hypothetical protein IPH88_17085 [Bacteroidales bacterium]|nr:hypothetical protein [Bacteroidales bacterium]
MPDKLTPPPMPDYSLPELFYARGTGTRKSVFYRILFIDAAPLKYDFSKKLKEASVSCQWKLGKLAT